MGFGASTVIFGFQGGGGGGGGGSQSWAQVLAVSNESGGTNPIITEGDVLSFGSNTSFYGDLFVGTTTLTANRTWELPNQSGVIALVSDIPANTNIYNSDGTISASINRNVNLGASSNLFFLDVGSNSLIEIYEDGRLALGKNSFVFDVTATALGQDSVANAANSISIGNTASAGALSVVVAPVSAAAYTNSTIVGQGISLNNTHNVIFGNIITNSGDYNVSLGVIVTNTGGGVAVGQGVSNTGGGRGLVIGRDSTQAGSACVSIGLATNNSGSGSFVAGVTVNITAGDWGQAIGNTIDVSETACLSFGNMQTNSHQNAIILGSGINNSTRLVSQVADSFNVGWFQTTPMIRLTKNTPQWINGSGNLWIGDGSAAANEGAPNNIPASISKLTVKGNVEVVGDGTGNVGVVIEADDGNRVLMQLVEVSAGVYAWNTGTIL